MVELILINIDVMLLSRGVFWTRARPEVQMRMCFLLAHFEEKFSDSAYNLSTSWSDYQVVKLVFDALQSS